MSPTISFQRNFIFNKISFFQQKKKIAKKFFKFLSGKNFFGKNCLLEKKIIEKEFEKKKKTKFIQKNNHQKKNCWKTIVRKNLLGKKKSLENKIARRKYFGQKENFWKKKFVRIFKRKFLSERKILSEKNCNGFCS